MRTQTTLLAMGLLTTLGVSPSTFGQSGAEALVDAPFEETNEDPAKQDLDFKFTFGGAYTHRFNTDIDSGGDVSNDTLSFGLTVDYDLNPDVSLIFQVNYGIASYDFGGTTGFGLLDPWDDINTFNFGAVLSVDVNEEISVFGGPVFQFAGESGADWGDTFTGGGIMGMTYRINDRFVLGGGVGIVSQIEDDVRFFPILIIEWRCNDQWRISSAGPSAGRASVEFTGVELVWNPLPKGEFAVGGASSYSRFRLDDTAFSSGGVGQDESTPLWLRATWRPNDTIGIDVIGGFTFGGELTLDDSNGDGVASSDYETTPFVGVLGSIRF